MVLPDPGQSRAVLIGTSTYTDARLHDLPAVRNNLLDLRSTLAGVFTAQHMTIVENPTDDRAVATTVAAVAAQASDVLLVYYAGHGVLGLRQHELFFALSDTDIDKPQYTALALQWVRDEIRDSPAKTKILILDCCFSGRAIDDFMADEESLIMGAVSVSGTYTLASSSSNAASLAPAGARHTAFTGELLELLHRGVPDGPDELDLHLIYRQLHQRMTAKGWPVPRQRGTDNVHGLALGKNAERRIPQPEPAAAEDRGIAEEIARLEAAFREPPHTRAPEATATSPVPPVEPRIVGRPPATAPAHEDPATARRAPEPEPASHELSLALTFGVLFVPASVPLFLIGGAVKHLFVGGISLGFWNYLVLALFALVIGFGIAVGVLMLWDTPANKASRTVAVIGWLMPLAVGILAGGHLWTWLDVIGLGLAHFFALSFF